MDYRQGPSVKDWVITFLITSVPCIGFIMLIIWALSGDEADFKTNYARGCLLFLIIIMIISFVISFMIGFFGFLGFASFF